MPRIRLDTPVFLLRSHNFLLNFKKLKFYWKVFWSTILLATLLVLAAARPQEFEDEEDGQSNDRKDDVARVQIKVYRGPTKHDGYAPWGFWVKQPSDEE
ncbi:hypothetical protein K1T71_012804 [Dendrolimus kikuchii]|uniref:Uncharacterized protein n=1 Tax=Dendrolimus kikuchii TaxID=765133 RepID=A0ACC1CI52_9NEOP|nr:hypothetical protein K1T71_012804 [Dendrolimus kikuchii]